MIVWSEQMGPEAFPPHMQTNHSPAEFNLLPAAQYKGRYLVEIFPRTSHNCRIFLNILHQVLAQLASFSTNSVNNDLIVLGDDGAKLITTSVQGCEICGAIFDRMDNRILQGTCPDVIL